MSKDKAKRQKSTVDLTAQLVLPDGSTITIEEAAKRFAPAETPEPMDTTTYELLRGTFMAPGSSGIIRPKEFNKQKKAVIKALGDRGHRISIGRLLKQGLVLKVPIPKVGVCFGLTPAGNSFITTYQATQQTAPAQTQTA